MKDCLEEYVFMQNKLGERWEFYSEWVIYTIGTKNIFKLKNII